MATAPAAPAGIDGPTLARLLNLSVRRVQQLAREGVIPRAARGRYELGPSVQGYIKYLQAQVDNPDETVAANRAKLDAARRRKIERENLVEEGKLISLDEIGETFVELGHLVRNAHRALSSRLASRLIGVDDEIAIERIIRTELDEVDRNLAERARASGASAPLRPRSRAAAQPRRGRVGGRKSDRAIG